ncbi:hypothetical protein [Bernardetia sp. MNP-M8]|uniref:hypothetical protein n=1 Tax=Bernardetia sp. MNP-M8 TaxID=3127470 RepID=UPI0030D3EEB7
MKNLKKRFGKFAVSNKDANRISGGIIRPGDPGTNSTLCCDWGDGSGHRNTICGYENQGYNLETVTAYCRSRSSQGCQTCYWM